MSTDDSLVVRRDCQGVRWLTLNRADKANALSAAVIDMLHDELDSAITGGVRVLVLSGGERHFSSGFDLSDLDQETDATLLQRFVRLGILLERLASAPFATIAYVDGPAVGAGADLAMACDHRLGTSRAGFRFPGVAFGAVLGVGRLASVVGNSPAMRFVSGGAVVDAQAAASAGLLTMCAERPQLESAIANVSAEMARVPGATLPALVRACRPQAADAGLAELVRSVAIPGLTRRIHDYANQARPKRSRARHSGTALADGGNNDD